MGENFAALIETAGRARGTRPALAWPGGGLTWDDLARRASQCAGALAARGVRAGDRVALALPNGWKFAAAFLGVLRLGATAAPLNPRLTAHELAGITADLAPALTVTGSAEAGAGFTVTGSPEAGAGFTATGSAEAGAGFTVIGSAEAGAGFTATGSPQTGDEPRPCSPAVAPALILYTSGSTGRPKGSVFSHEALIAANRSWAGPVMALTPADVVLGALPFAHSFGLNGALLAPLLAGACVVPLDRFAPESAVEAIDALGVTVLPAVATMFRRLLDSPALVPERIASLRLALSGAAPCPWELAEEWRGRTGVRLLRGYGMTELFRPISYLARDRVERSEAIGRAVPGVELRVVDDGGAPLPAEEVGELHVRSPARLERYLNAPDGAEALASDGWFATGDLARIGGDGLVSIVGRKKDLILRGGYSISPPEVEAVLAAHPAVSEAAVVGVPHPDLGEEVAAFVVLRSGAQARADALIAHCEARLAAFKCPRQVRFVSALPRGETGKVQKWRLGAS
jgi:long-chain acyl-CoA synthetase